MADINRVAELLAELLERDRVFATIENGSLKITQNGKTLEISTQGNRTIRSNSRGLT